MSISDASRRLVSTCFWASSRSSCTHPRLSGRETRIRNVGRTRHCPVCKPWAQSQSASVRWVDLTSFDPLFVWVLFIHPRHSRLPENGDFVTEDLASADPNRSTLRSKVLTRDSASEVRASTVRLPSLYPHTMIYEGALRWPCLQVVLADLLPVSPKHEVSCQTS